MGNCRAPVNGAAVIFLFDFDIYLQFAMPLPLCHLGLGFRIRGLFPIVFLPSLSIILNLTSYYTYLVCSPKSASTSALLLSKGLRCVTPGFELSNVYVCEQLFVFFWSDRYRKKKLRNRARAPSSNL